MKLKPINHVPDDPTPTPEVARRGRRRLRTIAVLPTLLTLGNLYFGFAAIYCCGREMQDIGAGVNPSAVRTLNSVFLETRAPSYLSIGVWLLIGAMICDALDGQVARRTGHASKFGEQMDSLADVVSFGVAPALLMVTMIHREIAQWGHAPFGLSEFGPVAVFIGLVYVCCAALRLARFNVEASLDDASHQGFHGLPTPGAAAAVISVVFLHDHLDLSKNWAWFTNALTTMLPLATLMVALLMVSRVPYRHALSVLLRRRPLGHVILMLLVLPLLWRYTAHMAFAAAWVFVASGLLRSIWRRVKGHPLPQPVTTERRQESTPPAIKHQTR
ncbi:MAG: phosphatidylcholine/phosphatidylserine synthase [Phycisphaerae bacterium]|nr:phosphatidylcholine/phosphatidylserine synthase [Phycisphaerae bacterium]